MPRRSLLLFASVFWAFYFSSEFYLPAAANEEVALRIKSDSVTVYTCYARGVTTLKVAILQDLGEAPGKESIELTDLSIDGTPLPSQTHESVQKVLSKFFDIRSLIVACGRHALWDLEIEGRP